MMKKKHYEFKVTTVEPEKEIQEYELSPIECRQLGYFCPEGMIRRISKARMEGLRSQPLQFLDSDYTGHQQEGDDKYDDGETVSGDESTTASAVYYKVL